MCETVQLGESSVSTGGPLVSHGKSLFVFVSVGPRTMCVKVTERDHVTPTAVPSHQGCILIGLMMSAFGNIFSSKRRDSDSGSDIVLYRRCSLFCLLS